jgi:hypothetical protein
VIHAENVHVDLCQIPTIADGEVTNETPLLPIKTTESSAVKP